MREEKVNSSGTVYYVRDGENVLLETDANLITQAHYTDYPGMWGGLASERRGDVSSFYGFDQQSNVRILVSSAGAVTDGYLYKAFGEELAVSGATVNSLRFGGEVGYWRDEAERLYVRRRVLRVDQGRWMSRDPLGFDGGDWNLYRYVGNNPVLGVDPIGMLFACGRKCCLKFMGDCHALWPGCCKGCKDCPPKKRPSPSKPQPVPPPWKPAPPPWTPPFPTPPQIGPVIMPPYEPPTGTPLPMGVCLMFCEGLLCPGKWAWIYCDVQCNFICSHQCNVHDVCEGCKKFPYDQCLNCCLKFAPSGMAADWCSNGCLRAEE